MFESSNSQLLFQGCFTLFTHLPVKQLTSVNCTCTLMLVLGNLVVNRRTSKLFQTPHDLLQEL